MIGKKISHYNVTAKLGAGGTGEIYRASDPSFCLLRRKTEMKPIAVIVAFLVLLTALPALAHDGVKDKKQEEGKRRGYVLKPGEGEKLGPVRIIKASPKSGTQGGVMVLDELPPGFTTGIHVHTVADEFFYIISGRGTATIGEKNIAIAPGDVVFVPAGGDHAISVDADNSIKLLTFVDKPGLEGFFREAHAKYFSKSKPLTLEACNAIGRKYAFVCKTAGSRP